MANEMTSKMVDRTHSVLLSESAELARTLDIGTAERWHEASVVALKRLVQALQCILERNNPDPMSEATIRGVATGLTENMYQMQIAYSATRRHGKEMYDKYDETDSRLGDTLKEVRKLKRKVAGQDRFLEVLGRVFKEKLGAIRTRQKKPTWNSVLKEVGRRIVADEGKKRKAK